MSIFCIQKTHMFTWTRSQTRLLKNHQRKKMSDMFQMFTRSPHSSGWQRSISPYTFTKVVLPCPYITLTWVHSLKRPDQTPSQDDDIFAIPLSEVCERLITYPSQRSSNRVHALSNPNSDHHGHKKSLNAERVKHQCSNVLCNVTQKLKLNPPFKKIWLPLKIDVFYFFCIYYIVI